jgi:NadR type nicotinamide-nucleotide adenylyltransferase
MLKKIAVIGPESTGKSSLCEQLAQHYHTLWCPEFAREYLSVHGTNYNYDDLLTIAKGQIALEEKYESLITTQESNKKSGSHHSLLTPHYSFLFIDTNMYVMKVWCEFVFGKCHQYILDQIAVRKYDLYLLCNIDLPWIADELREYPDLETRQRLYEIYKHIMINQPVPWVEISGDSKQRIKKAIQSVDDLLTESTVKK